MKICLIIIACIAISMALIIFFVPKTEPLHNFNPSDLTYKYRYVKPIEYFVVDSYGQSWQVNYEFYYHINLPVK
jgi:hypothetical protein